MQKMFRFNDWSMGRKLLAAFGLLILVVALVAGAAIIITTANLQSQMESQFIKMADLEAHRLGGVLATQVTLIQVGVTSDTDTIIQAVEASNAAFTGSEQEILSQLLSWDEEWQAAGPDMQTALMSSVLGNAASEKLREYTTANAGHAEVIVTDNRGALVAANQRTSDYYQADEEWWQLGWNNGQGAIHFGSPEYDESAGVWALAITVPIVNPQTGEVIGVTKTVYNLQSVIDEVGTFTLGQTGHEHIVDADGIFIAGPHPEDAGQPTEEGLLLDGAIFSGTTGFSTNAVGHEGESLVTGYAPISTGGRVPEIDELGWVVQVLQSRSEAFAPITRLVVTIAAATAAAVVAAVGLAFALSRFLTRQVDEISKVFRAVIVGNFDTRAQVLGSDELGQVADGLNAMLQMLSDLLTGAEELAEQRLAILENTTDLAGVGSLEGQILYMNPAGLEMAGFTDVEDVTTLSIADFYTPEEGRRVAEEVLPTVLERGSWSGEVTLRHRSGSLIPTTHVVTLIRDREGNPAGFGNIARDISDQKRVITDVEGAAVQVTSASSEMAEIVRLMVDQASSSAEVAEQATSSAHEGDRAVGDTIAAMGRIRENTQESARRIKRLGEVSQEISEAVRLIEEIADRTTVLALNASIQAAAAGEAGRGFAVVAEEVQRLAERAAGATRQIEDLVKGIQAETNEAAVSMEEATREVVEGSQLAQHAGERMADLNRLVGDLSNLIQHVAETTARQTDMSVTALTDLSQNLMTSVAGFGRAGGDGRTGGNGAQ